MLFLLLSACALFALSSCAGVSRDDLAGTYVMRLEAGTGTLMLRDDGTFVETVSLDAGVSQSVEGEWALDGSSKLIRSPCIDVDGDGLNGEIAVCSGGARWIWHSGNIVITVNVNDGLAYHRE